MEIKQKDNGTTGMFYIEQYADIAAKLSYVWAGNDKILIVHTEVGGTLKGKGVGKQLVGKVVDFAREKKLKIVPVCSFAKNIFDKVEEYCDVLQEQEER
jgi:predicted GNAT family acetyltransferase